MHYFSKILALVLLMTVLGHAASDPDVPNLISNSTQSAGPFPVCTDINTAYSPFCLPHHLEDVVTDATYYVTWNPDYYDLNATITIELRYPNSTQGDSAFTSAKTANSYGYIPLHMQSEWLQGRKRNSLTLYIIELDSTSNRRASVLQGPTITLHPRPTEHYKPPPQLPFNKRALAIGLPVGLAAVVLIVGGLYFGMRESRRIRVGNAMGSRGKGYGVGQSKNERLAGEAVRESRELTELRKYSDSTETDSSESKDLERASSDVFTNELTRLKSWVG